MVEDVEFVTHHFGGLGVAALVDGDGASCGAIFEHQHGAFGPVSGGEEGMVGGGVYEDVIEHVVVGIFGSGVGHVDARAEEDPLVVVGDDEGAIGGVLGDFRLGDFDRWPDGERGEENGRRKS